MTCEYGCVIGAYIPSESESGGLIYTTDKSFINSSETEIFTYCPYCGQKIGETK